MSNSPCAQPSIIFTTIFISCVLAATILVFKTGVYQPAHRCINFFSCFVTERTKIFRGPPQTQTVSQGTNVELKCNATADPSLELRYIWKKDGIEVISSKPENVLRILNISVDEAGIYTCVAFTPEPKRSEDSVSAIVSIIGTFHDLIYCICWFRKRGGLDPELQSFGSRPSSVICVAFLGRKLYNQRDSLSPPAHVDRNAY